MPQTHLCAMAYAGRPWVVYIGRLRVAHIGRLWVAHTGRLWVAHTGRLRVAHTGRLWVAHTRRSCMDHYNPVNDTQGQTQGYSTCARMAVLCVRLVTSDVENDFEVCVHHSRSSLQEVLPTSKMPSRDRAVTTWLMETEAIPHPLSLPTILAPTASVAARNQHCPAS